MYVIYSLLLGIAFVILLPRFLIDALRHGKYVAGFRERMGSVSRFESAQRPVIWIHAVSVGETQAARPLVKALKTRFPNHAIVFSTITQTGQTLAREVLREPAEKIFYFPFDWPWSVRSALRAINPSIVIIMETELWPVFLRECSRRNVPVVLMNGRLSGQSFRRYRLIKRFMRRVLSSVSFAVMQTEADAARLHALGMNPEKTKVCGNLKFDAGSTATDDSLSQQLRSQFSLDASPFILAASTHAPEERIVLNAFKKIVANAPHPKPRLVIAPRHPERFREVANLIEASGLSWTRRTAKASVDPAPDVILLDTIGELQPLYTLATVVFVGGSIAKAGGHNILEPAAAKACVISGAHTHNFQLIMETFVKAGAVVQLPPMPESEAADELCSVISDLLANPSRRDELGRRALKLVNQNRGSTDRALTFLKPFLDASSTVETEAQPGIKT
jgi:3-deoxy-D-manno-octulosonic-acid transferase